MAKDQDFEAAVEKGTRLLQMLTKETKTSVQSVFKDAEELAQHGYHMEPQQTNLQIECLAEALRDLGVDGEENVRIFHVHGRDDTVEGEEHNTTCGYFCQVANPRAGVLIADTNLTPVHAAAFNDTEEEEFKELPPLRHWSDTAFLQYLSSFPSPHVRPIPINYVFRLRIQNSTTFLVLNKVIDMHGHSMYDLWPGFTFSLGSEEGRAILGTPNGSGVAWMLIQHIEMLGERTIDKVTVFYAPKEGRSVCMAELAVLDFVGWV